MAEVTNVDETVFVDRLRRLDFCPQTAQRLAAQIVRKRAGDLPDLELTPDMLFICWLVDRGYLTDDLPDGPDTVGAGEPPAHFLVRGAYERRAT